MPLTIRLETFSAQLEQLPWLAPFLSKEIFGNTVAHYVVVALVVLIVYLGARGITYLIEKHAEKIAKKTASKMDDIALNVIHRSITFILVLTAFYFGVKSLNVPESVDTFAVKLVFILFTLKITRELDFFLKFVIESYIEPLARRQKGFVKTFVPPLLRFTKIVIWMLAVLLIMSNLGYNITSLIAGLGIGGLALALAAQETLSNVFGSIAILADQPFKVGDWVTVEDYSGTILEVGMRSTKIQTIDKSIVSVPNKTIAASVVENVSRRNMMKVEQVLSFKYGTSLMQMKELLKGIEQVIRKDADTDKDTIRVHFLEFGESALEVQVFYYITDTSSYARMLDIRQRINLKIKEKVEKIGADMAYPTKSLYLENAKDLSKAIARRKARK